MTPDELQTLQYFKHDTLTYQKTSIAWEGYHYPTMQWLNILRQHVKSPIQVIRGGTEHGVGKETAVDAVCPQISLQRLFLGVTRLPGASWGLYEGSSFHIDLRAYDLLPARWMAFKNTAIREQQLFTRGLGNLITHKKDGWIYLDWNADESFTALGYLVKLHR